MDKLRIHDLRHIMAGYAVMWGENLPLVSKLLGYRRHRTRSLHGPFRGFAWAIYGSFRPGIFRIFQAILNYF